MAVFNQIGGISTGSITGALGGPLSKLLGLGAGADLYQYPDNLATDPTRGHWIQFCAYKPTPALFDPASPSQSAVSDNALTEAAAPSPTGLAAIGSAIGSFLGVGGKKSASDRTESGNIGAVINLFMPDTLQVSYSNEYDELSLSRLANIGLEATKSIKEKLDAGQSAGQIGGAVKSAAQAMAPEAGLTGLQALGVQDAAAIGLANLNNPLAINPRMQMVYRGINFRTFELEFLMTPKTQSEADMVSKICNAFIYCSAPRVSGPGNLYFEPPYRFVVSFRMAVAAPGKGIMDALTQAGNSVIPGLPLGNAVSNLLGGGSGSKKDAGSENQRLMKFGRCVLENVDVNYAPNGWAAHPGGVPLQTKLTLQFKEIDILDKTRLEKGEMR